MAFPKKVVAGDSLQLTINSTEYTGDDGYAIKVHINGPSEQVHLWSNSDLLPSLVRDSARSRPSGS
jgi:hypothetical protein